MAITNNGTKVSLRTDKLPSGYTLPTVTTISDYDYIKRVTLSVLKATVENATKTTTLTNIIGNATVGINKQVTDIIAADILATATVTHYQELIDINSNISVNGTSDFFNATAVSYVCTVLVYVKAV